MPYISVVKFLKSSENMEIIKTKIPDLLLLQPKVFEDDRGYFLESWNQATFQSQGLDINFVQDNESQSSRGTLRGIHLQVTHPQGKLVRVTQGEVYDVAVDLRPESPSCGEWSGFTLSSENKSQLWIPPGFGHAFLTISETATFNYKCSELYYGDDQYTLAYDDSAVGVEWPLKKNELKLSEKDSEGWSLDKVLNQIKQQNR